MKKAFTLIELVMVIVIIGIIAVVAIPKIQDIKQKAVNRSEQAIMASLKTAINMKHMQNIIEHPDQSPDALWPCKTADEIPFTLMQNPPPYFISGSGPGAKNGDWLISFRNDAEWSIQCPCWINGPANPNEWCYYPVDYLSMKAGTFWTNPSHGHSPIEEKQV